MRIINISPRIRSITHLGATSTFGTCWLGNIDMERIYFRIEQTIREIYEVEEFMTIGLVRRSFSATMVKFENFESINVNLQQKIIPPNQVRFLFRTHI